MTRKHNTSCGDSCFFSRDEASLRKLLSPEQYRIVRENATEKPFANAYWDNHEDGIYIDVLSGEALFCSKDKFDSGTGWPSFTKAIDCNAVSTRNDQSSGISRTEVRSRQSDSHLGHLFPDGPGPSGLRYCINSASLRFVPVSKMEEEGYDRFLFLFEKKTSSEPGITTPAIRKTENATFAAGCFWGVEEHFRALPGVLSTSVGYTGGTTKNPSYEDVCTDRTGHAEAVNIEFDPSVISYEKLLELFWKIHDPTSKNHQGPDYGSQYRSAVFFHSKEQEKAAQSIKEEFQKSGKMQKPIATEIVPAGEFYRAEEYHQFPHTPPPSATGDTLRPRICD